MNSQKKEDLNAMQPDDIVTTGHFLQSVFGVRGRGTQHFAEQIRGQKTSLGPPHTASESGMIISHLSSDLLREENQA